jgi:hypothetical protein
MSPASTAERARTRLATLRQRILRLRGTGPNPFDYWIWADETRAVLATIFGEGSPEENAFSEIVGTRGRTADQRGQADNMTLGLHGEWGIWARLDRSEALLSSILERMASSE